MRQSNSAKASSEAARTEEIQLACAFDVIVRETGRRFQPTQLELQDSKAAEIGRQLHAAQQTAKEIQHEIQKRIKEMQKLRRRAAA